MGRLPCCIALSAAAACASERRPSAQVDTTTPRRTVEVLAQPADSALRAATTTFDSLSSRFTLARAALDSEASALERVSRLDSSYARRYGAFEAKRKSALEMRTVRDRARRARDSIAARSAPTKK